MTHLAVAIAFTMLATACSASTTTTLVPTAEAADEQAQSKQPSWPSELTGTILIHEIGFTDSADDPLYMPSPFSILKMLDLETGVIEQIDFGGDSLSAAKWALDHQSILIHKVPERGSDSWFYDLVPGEETQPVDLPRILGTPDWGPDCASVVVDQYLIDGDAFDGLWIHRLDGSPSVKLATSTNKVGPPDWSADGSRIVYTVWHSSASTSEVWLINPDGTDNTRLMAIEDGAGLEPQLSPDATQVVFKRGQDITPQLMIVDIDTGRVQQLTDAPFPGVSSPTFSPDGEWIAFATGSGISVIRPDGSELHEVAQLDSAYLLDWGSTAGSCPT